MTSRERLILAMERQKPDHLPATVHSWMQYFLDKYVDGVDQYRAYELMGLDPVIYDCVYKDGVEGGMFWHNKDMLQRVDWVVKRNRKKTGKGSESSKLEIVTPKKTLTMALESNPITTWITENLVKDKEDIYILDEYMPYPEVDVRAVNSVADGIGERGILRTHVFGYGQPGCWQDACCFYGSTKMIYAAYDDPEWVHDFLKILLRKQITVFLILQIGKNVK